MTIERLLLKPEEAAEVLSIGRSKVYELMGTGELASVRIGNSRRFRLKHSSSSSAGSEVRWLSR